MKKRITAIILSVVIMFSMIPFSIVKAETISSGIAMGNIEDPNDNVVGTYTIDQVYASGTNDRIDLDAFGVISEFTCKYGIIIDVTFDKYYSGTLNVGFSFSVTNYEVIWIYGDGVSSWNTASGTTLVIPMNDTKSFKIYLFDTSDEHVNNGQPIWIQAQNLTSSSINDIILDLADYQLPWYQVTAFALASQDPNQVIYNNGDVSPHLHITSGSRSRTVSVPTSGTRHFIFISSVNLTSSSTTGSITSSNSYVSCTFSSIAPYTFSGGYRMYDLTFINGNTSSQNFYMNYNTTFDMIPIFYGMYGQMPEDVYAVVNGTHIYDNQLSRIIQALNAIGDSGTTSQDIGNISDQVDDITDQEHDITDGFISDLDDFNTNVDLDNYDFISGIVGISSYFKIQLENVFNESSYIRAFWIIPVICVVFIRLLGS